MPSLMAGSVGMGLVLTFKDFASRGMRQAEQNFNRLDKSTERAARMQQKATTAMKAGAGAMLAGGGIIAALGLTVKAASDYQHEMKVFQAISGASSEVVQDMSSNFLELTATLPASANEMVKVAQSAAKMGVFAKQGQEGVEEFAFRMIQLRELLPDVPVEELSMKVSRMMNIMGTAPSQLQNLASTIAQVANSTAATGQEVLDTTERFQGFGKVLGMTEAEVLAMAGATLDAGQTAQVGASALSRFFSEMAMDMEGFGEFVGMTGEQLRQVFRTDAPQAISLFVDKLASMKGRADEQAVALEELGLGGIRVSRALLGLTAIQGQLEEKTRAATAAFEDGTLLQTMYMEIATSLDSKMRTLGGSLQNIAIEIGKNLIPVVKPIIDLFISLTDKILKLPPPILKAITMFAGITGVALLVGGALLTIVGGLGLLIANAPIAIAAIGGLLSALSTFLPIILAIVAGIMLVRTAFVENWGGIATFVGDIFRKIGLFFKAFIQGVRDGFISKEIMDELGGPFSTVGVIIRKLIVTVWNIKSAWEGFLSVIRKIGQGPVGTLVKQIIDLIKGMGEFVGLIFGSKDAIEDTSDSWQSAGKAIGKALEVILVISLNIIKYQIIMVSWLVKIGAVIGKIVSVIVGTVWPIIRESFNLLTRTFTAVVDWIGTISDVWNQWTSGTLSFWEGLGKIVQSTWNLIVTIVKGSINTMIEAINMPLRGINALAKHVGIEVPLIPTIMDVGGSPSLTPNMQNLQKRGVRIPALLEEGERVAPIGAAGAESLASPYMQQQPGGSQKIVIEIPLMLDGKQIYRVVKEIDIENSKRNYSVRKHVGRGTV